MGLWRGFKYVIFKLHLPFLTCLFKFKMFSELGTGVWGSPLLGMFPFACGSSGRGNAASCDFNWGSLGAWSWNRSTGWPGQGLHGQKPYNNPEQCDRPPHPSDEWEHWNPEKCHNPPQLFPVAWHKSEDLRLSQDLPESTFSNGLTSRQKNKEKENLNNTINQINWTDIDSLYSTRAK